MSEREARLAALDALARAGIVVRHFLDDVADRHGLSGPQARLLTGLVEPMPMAAAAAVVDPHMAPKPAQARMVAMARPPGRRPAHLWAALKRRLLMPEWKAMVPMRMNIGATDSEYEEKVAQMSLATMLSAESHDPEMMNPTKPTTPMA